MKPLFTFLLLTLSFLSYGQFRNTTWGMTQQQIIEAEGMVEYEIDDLDNYDPLERGLRTIDQIVTIDSALVQISYMLENGKLTGGMYSFSPLNEEDKDAHNKLWKMTLSNLAKKYGKKYHMVGDSYNWNLPDLTIKAFNMDVGIAGGKLINVIYDSVKVKQEDIL
ncbi:hypothetical protein FAZ15_03265 [Sphingobacterium olei]|uniref:Uncharacterized protein n=1 Tax=Sphingobacterium olei TaxID=2571155 RepID=A0A4U0P905_9SPHI|nr:hypothetical protein [Sphingobacterium olei]TJZ63312.1 hypothetical protein FAZ15_03265 [Sphingobacterium olei]